MQQSRRDKRCTLLIINLIGNGNFDYQPYHKLTNFLRPNYRAIFQSFNRPVFFCFYSRFFRTNINKVQTTKSSSLAFSREEAKISKRSSHLSLLSREEVQKTKWSSHLSLQMTSRTHVNKHGTKIHCIPVSNITRCVQKVTRLVL